MLAREDVGVVGPEGAFAGFEHAVEERGGLGQAAYLAESAGQLTEQIEGLRVIGAESGFAFRDDIAQGSLLGRHRVHRTALNAGEAFLCELFDFSDQVHVSARIS